MHNTKILVDLSADLLPQKLITLET